MRIKAIARSLLTTYGAGLAVVLVFMCVIKFSGHHVHVRLEIKSASTPQQPRQLYHVTTTELTDYLKHVTTGMTMVYTRDKLYLDGNNSREIKDGQESSFCGMTITKEMDLLKMKKLAFNTSYKNPCWKNNKGRLRCIPYMYLVGVAKCGTTDLFSRITRHPDFIGPSIKETNWLSAGRFWRDESFDYFSSHFFLPLIKILESDRTHTRSKRLITGDASINTITGAHALQYLGNNVGKEEPVENNPEYIHHLYNETRILMIFRNPIDRLWSEYLAFSSSKKLSPERFHQIVERSLKAYNDCLAVRPLRSCIYDRAIWSRASMNDAEYAIYGNLTCNKNTIDIVMLQRGVYHVFVEDYLRVFRRDHVLIQRLEDMSENPTQSLELTYSFLGLRKLPLRDTARIVHAKIRNAKKPGREKVGNMLPETRELLYKFYKPHNEKLAKMLNNNKYNYGHIGG